MTKTPVAITIFKRPDTTERVFQRVREAQPETLFIIADGARTLADVEGVYAARKVTDHVDWKCDVYRFYADTNLGVAWRYPTGLTEAFRIVDRIIALEDDTLPDLSYFQFVDELLDYYENDTRVAIIGGSSFNTLPTQGQSYYFTHSLWHQGVAFWKRTWQQYSQWCESWGQSDVPRRILQKRYQGEELNGYIAAVERAYHDPGNDAYDYKLSYAWTAAGQWAITPTHNLITNIGFRSDGTHPNDENHPNANIPTAPMPFPLVHPDTVPEIVTP
jgi:hypothetical protein